MKILYVAAFGLLGVLARYAAGLAAERLLLPSWHATFLVNILGAFLIGIAFVLGVEKGSLAPELRLGIMVGFLGGFTTFSSLALEGLALYTEGRAMHAAVYVFFSNALGIGAVALGMALARR